MSGHLRELLGFVDSRGSISGSDVISYLKRLDKVEVRMIVMDISVQESKARDRVRKDKWDEASETLASVLSRLQIYVKNYSDSL